MALFSECMLSCARKCLTPPTLLETPVFVNPGPPDHAQGPLNVLASVPIQRAAPYFS